MRAIGASNFTAERLPQSLEVAERTGLPRYESLQPHYNLYDRAAFEGDLERVCRENEVGVIPYFSLASGFLTGKYRSEADLGQEPARPGRQEVSQRARPAHPRRPRRGRGDHHATPAQVALAWLIARPGITAPIASATRLEQLDELIGATRLKLEPEEVETLDRAGAATS